MNKPDPKRLCCFVKKQSTCHRCDKPVCPEHQVECAECGISCSWCSSAEPCSVCSTEVCRFCMRIDGNKQLKCTMCVEFFPPAEHPELFDPCLDHGCYEGCGCITSSYDPYEQEDSYD